jgi:hypothetical protein
MLKTRLRQIEAYESFCSLIEDAFNWLRYLSSQAGARAIGNDDFAARDEVVEIVSNLTQWSVAAVIRKRKRKNRKDIELDPLKRVNTEEFLLRRTQRVALALERMREKLERPVLTNDALEWRISGPLGPKALAEVLIREAKQPAEAAFFLAELSLTVGRVTSEKPAAGGLPKAVIEAALNDCVHFLHVKLDGIDASAVPSDIWRYVKDAFREASK